MSVLKANGDQCTKHMECESDCCDQQYKESGSIELYTYPDGKVVGLKKCEAFSGQKLCPPRLDTGLVTLEVLGVLFVLGFVIYGIFAYLQKSREVETLRYKL